MNRNRVIEALRRAIAAVERVLGLGADEAECRELLAKLREELAGFERASDEPELSDLSEQLEEHEAWLGDPDFAVVLEAAREVGKTAHMSIPIKGAAPPMDLEGLPESFSIPVVEEHENYSVIRVFYATDRAREVGDREQPKFGGDRSVGRQLNFGECLISVPKVRKVGELQSPSIWRLEFRPDPNKHIVLLETISRQEEEFLKLVGDAVQLSPEREAFVFIHGYNVSFENAARRTGQIAFDLSFQGAPIFYSWPSRAKTAGYMRDEAAVAWSAPNLERFLRLLGQSGAARIHIIAHSMGNRAACEALKEIHNKPIPGLQIRHLILAAPDIDAETFDNLAKKLKEISYRVTLYASSNDKALWASEALHGYPRAGQAGEGIVIIPDVVDTIDASAISTDFLAHSYFSDSQPLLGDIHALLNHDHKPEERFRLFAVTKFVENKPVGRYFAFRGN